MKITSVLLALFLSWTVTPARAQEPEAVEPPRIEVRPRSERRVPPPAPPASEGADTPAVSIRTNLPASRSLLRGPIRWVMTYNTGHEGSGPPSILESYLRVREADLIPGRSYGARLNPVPKPSPFKSGRCREPATEELREICHLHTYGVPLVTSWDGTELTAKLRCSEQWINAGGCLTLADLVKSSDATHWELTLGNSDGIALGPTRIPPVPTYRRPARPVDRDGDGFPEGEDCDDRDPDRFPGNPEICDAQNRDEDCDPNTFGALDRDNDGYPDDRCANVIDGRERSRGTDCDDRDPQRRPGLPEARDGKDNDCDGEVDEYGR